MSILTEPGFRWSCGRLVTERPGRRVWRFEAAGRARQGLSVGGTEHLTLPALAPSLQEVGVHLDWFGPATRPAQLLSPLTTLAGRIPGAERGTQWLAATVGRRVAAEPSVTSVARGRTVTVAEVRDHGGALVTRVELSGPEAYTFTAAMLAWGATTAASGGARGAGAQGPVAAFGLEALTAGAAEAGLRRS
jgi:hypothetical protein